MIKVLSSPTVAITKSSFVGFSEAILPDAFGWIILSISFINDRCPEVPPNNVNCVPPVDGKCIIRAEKSVERVSKVTFDSEEAEYIEVEAQEILVTEVPKVPSQICSRDHLQLTFLYLGISPFSECFCFVEGVCCVEVVVLTVYTYALRMADCEEIFVD